MIDAGGLTADSLDNLSHECVDAGSNAELRLIRTVQPRDDACISLRCQRSANPAVDCPYLD
ncbi:hypothetical protein [Nannocystis pusilla]|uniref:hypothetical protein n=1 Tax=Nannocystis pusilla TaxID=889268 RepID=UPI003B787531